MDVKDVRLYKNSLQLNITTTVSKLVEDFKEKTGVSPTYISIDMAPAEISKAYENIVKCTEVCIEI